MTERAAFVALLGLCAVACADRCGSDPAPGTPSEAAGSTSPAASETSAAEPEPAPEPPLARVRGPAGERRPGRGEPLEPGSAVRTGSEGSLAVDFRTGARAELGPSSHAVLGDESEAELFVARGRVRGLLPPAGNSPRPPLRLATPAGTVEIPGSGDVWVVTLTDGSAHVAVLAGRATVTSGAIHAPSDGAEVLVRRTLAAGEAGSVGALSGPDEDGPGDGPANEAEAKAWAAKLRDGAPSAAPKRLGTELEAQLARLDERVEALAAELERGQRIEAAHRTAVAEGADQAGALQQDLVEHSQARFRLRSIVLARWERVRALASLLAGAADAGPEADLAARATRVRRVLGFETGSSGP